MEIEFSETNDVVIETAQRMKVEVSFEVSEGDEFVDVTFDILYDSVADENTFTGYKYENNEYHVADDPNTYDPEDDLMDGICYELASNFDDKEEVSEFLGVIREKITEIKEKHEIQE